MSITGNLRTLELSELLQWLAQGKKTGLLVVERGALEKRIYFEDGRIISSSSNDPEEHLGTFLVQRGYVDESTLEHAMKLQEATQILLGKVLVTLDSISENDLEKILRLKTEESVYELFRWEEGDFRFIKDERPDSAMVPVSLEVTNIVMEGMRRLDESNHEQAVVLEGQASRDARSLQADGATRVMVELTPIDSDRGHHDSLEPLLLTDQPSSDLHEAPDAKDSGELGTSPEIRGYYQTLPQGKRQRVALFGGAASLVLVIALVVVWIFRQQPEPATAELTEAVVTEALPPRVTVAPAASDLGTLPPLETGTDLEEAFDPALAPEPEPTPEEIEQRVERLAAARSAEIEESLKSQYEQELTDLRRQLAVARQAALERERALQRQTARTETQSEQASEIAAEPTGGEPASVEETEAPQQTLIAQMEANRSAEADTISPPNPTSGVEPSPAVEETFTPLPPPATEPQPSQPQVEPGDLVGPGRGVTPPKLLKGALPRYPPIAQRMKREANVSVSLLVDQNGRVIEAHSVGPKVGMGFEQAAVDAARETIWAPAEKDGVRVKMRVELTIEFRL